MFNRHYLTIVQCARNEKQNKPKKNADTYILSLYAEIIQNCDYCIEINNCFIAFLNIEIDRLCFRPEISSTEVLSMRRQLVDV